MGFPIVGAVAEDIHRCWALEIAAQLNGGVAELNWLVRAVVQPRLLLPHGQGGGDAESQGRGQGGCEQAGDSPGRLEPGSTPGQSWAASREQDRRVAGRDQQESRDAEIRWMDEGGDAVGQR